MAQSVKLGDDIMASVRREAGLHGRSVSGQIAHWLRIGRAAEYSGRFDHARITAALEGKLDTTHLGEEEEAAWIDAFTEKMAQPTAAEDSFYHAAASAPSRARSAWVEVKAALVTSFRPFLVSNILFNH